LFFTLREAGREEPTSTNLDIYAVRDGGGPDNLTAANKATDSTPAVSPDGRWLAYTSMARPGTRPTGRSYTCAISRQARCARSPASGIGRSDRSPGRRTGAACW
jgi:Tol biopolymer transport system component